MMNFQRCLQSDRRHAWKTTRDVLRCVAASVWIRVVGAGLVVAGNAVLAIAHGDPSAGELLREHGIDPAPAAAGGGPGAATWDGGGFVAAGLVLFGLLLGLTCSFGIARWKRPPRSSETAEQRERSNRLEQQQKRTRDEVDRLARRLKMATEGVGVGVWDFNLQSDELIWNDTMRKLYAGPDAGEAPSFDFWQSRIHPDDRPATTDLIHRALHLDAVFDTTFRLLLPGGRVRHVRALATVDTDEKGEPRHMIGVNWDVTDTVTAYEKMERSEARLRRVMDSLYGFVAHLDNEGRVRDVNRAALDVSGLSLDDVVGKRFDETYWWSHDEAIQDKMREAIHKAGRGAVARFEASYIRSANRFGTSDVAIGPLLDEQGEMEGLIAFGVDVSERVAAEQRLDMALRAANIGIWDWNPQNGQTFFSDTFYTMLGYEPGELPSNIETWKELCHPDDLPEALAEVNSYLRGETPAYSKDHRLRRKDGSWFWVQGVGEIVERNDDATPVRILGVNIAVDRERRREDSLRELTTAMDAATDCVFLFERDSLRFVYANYGAVQQVGVDWAELCALTPLDIKPDYDEASLREMIQPLIETPGAALNFRTRHLRRDGGTIPVEVALQFIPTLGLNGRFIEIVRDITEQIETETRLDEARAKAEAASQAKSEFLANMSHEIRTPMTSILGFADILAEDDLSDIDPQTRIECATDIQRNARHLLTVINDILDMSKIEAGRMELESVRVDPRSPLEEVASLMRLRSKEKGIELDMHADPDLPSSIETDPIRVRQILLNLTGNAIKFTREGGVTVRGSYHAQEGMLRFRVEDTGIGMNCEQLALVSRFDAFTQADTSTTRRYGGSGLGLRISNALAQMLHGRIKIESTPGEGSVFTLVLPAREAAWSEASPGENPVEAATDVTEEPVGSGKDDAPASAESTEASVKPGATPGVSPAAEPLAGVRILLAEDGPDNQRLLKFLLSRAGAGVEIAEDGLAAAETVENAPADGGFDLVLMDMQMPRLDGYAATRRLRKRGFTLPIIALTAHAMAEDRTKCLDAGCDEYLSKPIDRELLIDTCRQWGRGDASTHPTPEPPDHADASTPADPDDDTDATTGIETSAETDGSPASVPSPASAPTSAPDPLWSDLAGDEDMQPLIEMYVDELAQHADELLEVQAAGEYDALARLAHRLKGSGTSHGFERITQAAARLEHAAKAPEDLSALDASVDELVDLCRRATAGADEPAAFAPGTSRDEPNQGGG